jgi:hypothetical protein
MFGRDDPRAGHPNGDPPEMPADLAAIQADDALLDMLGSADCMPGDVDDELARVLASWRSEVHADSVRELVHTDTAVAVINAARRSTRRHNPLFGRFAAAAAMLVIAFSAVGLLAKSAQPGDNLWGVTEVLYTEYARSVEAAAFVQTELNQAQKALQEDKPEQAKASLERIRQRLPAVAEAEGKTDLIARQRELERELGADSTAQGSSSNTPDASSSKQPAAPMPSTSSTTTPTEPPSSVKPNPPSPVGSTPSSPTEPSPPSPVKPTPPSPTEPSPPSPVKPTPPSPRKPTPPSPVKPNSAPGSDEPSVSQEPEQPPVG